MIRLFSELVEYNFNNLRKWRCRYSKKEYPYKVVLNMFYDLIPLEMSWSELLNCFKQGKKTDSLDEGVQQVFQIFRNSQMTISGSMDDYFRTGIQVGSSSSERLIPAIIKAQSGDNRSVEEIEFSYIAGTSLKSFTLIWASLGLTGETMKDAYQKISEVILPISDFENFDIVFEAFEYPVNAMIGGMVMGNKNLIIKPLYSPLPDLWDADEQDN